MKYLANFAEEIDGTNYEAGAEVNVKGLDEGTLDYLVRDGRLTVIGDNDPKVPATGADDDTTIPNGGQRPLGSMTKAELLDAAASEGATATEGNTKAEIIEAIEAKRNG